MLSTCIELTFGYRFIFFNQLVEKYVLVHYVRIIYLKCFTSANTIESPLYMVIVFLWPTRMEKSSFFRLPVAVTNNYNCVLCERKTTKSKKKLYALCILFRQFTFLRSWLFFFLFLFFFIIIT